MRRIYRDTAMRLLQLMDNYIPAEGSLMKGIKSYFQIRCITAVLRHSKFSAH